MRDAVEIAIVCLTVAFIATIAAMYAPSNKKICFGGATRDVSSNISWDLVLVKYRDSEICNSVEVSIDAHEPFAVVHGCICEGR